MADEPEFSGAKLVCLIGGRLLTLLRDDTPEIPFPDHWDLPGGGREGDESAVACVLRETQEEFGLRLSPEQLIWRQDFASPTLPGTGSAWFGARLPSDAAANIRFGQEGQRWDLVPPATWLVMSNVVPHFPDRVRLGLNAMDKCLKNQKDTPISGPLSAAYRQE